MKDKTCTSHHLTQNRWFHLGFSIALAFLLALVLLFIPITVGTTPIPASDLLQSESMPFGVALVHAANGVTLTKSAALTVTPGGVLTYTLTVTNGTGGTLNPADVVVKEEAPANTTLDCSSAPALLPPGWTILGSCSTSAITWGLVSTMAAGDSVDLIISVNVDDPLPGGYIVNDQYWVWAISGPPDLGPPFTTTVNASAWEITKTVSSNTIQPGQYLTYTITITNNGSTVTTGQYTITDQLPNDTHYVTGSASPAATFDGANLRWVLSDPVDPGQSVTASFVVTVTTPLTLGTPLVNQTYNVSGGGVYTPTTAGDPITVTVESEAVLEISKVASTDPITVGQVLTYTITVTNVGSAGPAQGVVITDTLPGELLYQSAGFVGGSTGAITDTGDNPIIWTLDNMIAPNNSAQVTLTVQVTDVLPAPPVITNTFEASADNAPLVSEAMTVGVKAGAVAVVTLTVDSPINNLCETTVATVTVVDSFNNPVSGASVFIVVFGAPTGDIDPDSASGNTNNSGIFTTTFRGTKAGLVRMIASGGSQPSNLFDLQINTGSPIPVNLNLTASPDPLFAGGNTGVVTGTLTDCQSPTPQPVPGKPITFTLSNVGLATFPGPPDSANGNTDANGLVTATLTSTSTETADGTLTITGTSEGAGWSLQDTVTLTIQPAPAPVLTITKVANPASGNTIEPGNAIVYDLVLTNTGTAAANNIVITDSLVSHVGFVTGSVIPAASGAGPFNNNGVITFSVPSLGVGVTVTARIEVTVTASISGTVITNTATANDQTGNVGPSNMISHRVITTTSTSNNVYLPIILKQ